MAEKEASGDGLFDATPCLVKDNCHRRKSPNAGEVTQYNGPARPGPAAETDFGRPPTVTYGVPIQYRYRSPRKYSRFPSVIGGA